MPIKHIRIGSILKTVGVKGELKLDVDETFEEDLLASKHVFVLINGDFVPYFIESIREQDAIIVKFDDVNNPESANAIARKDVYLRESQITSAFFHREKELTTLEGFILVANGREIGTIDRVSVMPQQIMAEFMYEGKPKMVPLVEEWILDIDVKKGRLTMQLPEGLLEI
jgi:16S rRNA processing protein RimM